VLCASGIIATVAVVSGVFWMRFIMKKSYPIDLEKEYQAEFQERQRFLGNAQNTCKVSRHQAYKEQPYYKLWEEYKMLHQQYPLGNPTSDNIPQVQDHLVQCRPLWERFKKHHSLYPAFHASVGPSDQVAAVAHCFERNNEAEDRCKWGRILVRGDLVSLLYLQLSQNKLRANVTEDFIAMSLQGVENIGMVKKYVNWKALKESIVSEPAKFGKFKYLTNPIEYTQKVLGPDKWKIEY